jgi:hypothetical protein
MLYRPHEDFLALYTTLPCATPVSVGHALPLDQLTQKRLADLWRAPFGGPARTRAEPARRKEVRKVFITSFNAFIPWSILYPIVFDFGRPFFLLFQSLF